MKKIFSKNKGSGQEVVDNIERLRELRNRVCQVEERIKEIDGGKVEGSELIELLEDRVDCYRKEINIILRREKRASGMLDNSGKKVEWKWLREGGGKNNNEDKVTDISRALNRKTVLGDGRLI